MWYSTPPPPTDNKISHSGNNLFIMSWHWGREHLVNWTLTVIKVISICPRSTFSLVLSKCTRRMASPLLPPASCSTCYVRRLYVRAHAACRVLSVVTVVAVGSRRSTGGYQVQTMRLMRLREKLRFAEFLVDAMCAVQPREFSKCITLHELKF